MYKVSKAKLALTVGLLVLVCGAVSATSRLTAAHRVHVNSRATTQPSAMKYSAFPIYFEPNVGQADSSIRYFSHTADYTLSITRSGTVLVLAPENLSKGRTHSPAAGPVIGITLHGAQATSVTAADQELAGHVNYLIGNDPAKWRTDIPTYRRIVQHRVWPGIDLAYHGSARGLEYDFIVAPGADPGRVAMDFDGIDRAEIDSNSDLVLHSGKHEVLMLKPSVYQKDGNDIRHVSAVWSSIARKESSAKHERVSVGFRIGPYDRSKPLIIDPVLKYSSFLNDTAVAVGNAVAVDRSGNVYVTGLVFPPGFPTSSGAYQTACYTGAGGSFGCANQDAFVIKINPALSGAKSLVYATYLGGSANGGPGFTSFFAGEGNGIAVDSFGDAYVTGFTESGDFPVKNPFLSGCPVNEADGCNAAFVTELNPQGSGLIYSTYLAGNGTPYGGDSAAAIAIDASRKIYVTGMAQSTNFPVTAGAYKTAFPTNCPGGMVLGNCTSAFVTELNPALSGADQLVYSTYLGGSGDGGYGDSGTGIAVALGRIYVTGSTVSTNFPVTSSALLWTNAWDAAPQGPTAPQVATVSSRCSTRPKPPANNYTIRAMSEAAPAMTISTQSRPIQQAMRG